MTPSYTFTPCQQHAINLLESESNVFLTGFAGTGKSFLVRKFIAGLDLKKFPVLASTGAAAVLINGRTFHSFFGLGIFEGGLEATVKRACENKRVRSRIKKIEGFILDEVSMIPGEALDAAEAVCRLVRMEDAPWGGVRVIAVGDFAQLPPVGRNSRQHDWAFQSRSWASADFKTALLKTIVRTHDDEFVGILNQVRHGIVSDELKTFLDRKTDTNLEDYESTCLFPKRDKVDRYNEKKLAEIEEPLVSFATEYQGRESDVNSLKRNVPIPEILTLKKSAYVMIRVNDPQYRYINGTTGFIEDMSADVVLVRLKNRKLIEIEKNTFALQNGDGEVVAAATNFPLTLAYAMTIHKSQGATLSDALIDLCNLWEPGQAYVALSRLENSSGLRLLGWTPSSIRADKDVLRFQEGLK